MRYLQLGRCTLDVRITLPSPTRTSPGCKPLYTRTLRMETSRGDAIVEGGGGGGGAATGMAVTAVETRGRGDAITELRGGAGGERARGRAGGGGGGGGVGGGGRGGREPW